MNPAERRPDLSARLAAVTGSRARRPDATPASPEPVGERERTYRVTVEVPRRQHRQLRLWALDHDADASAVVRALLAQLEADPALAERIAAAVRRPRRRPRGGGEGVGPA